MDDYKQLENYRNALNTFAIKNGVKTIEIREGFARCELHLDSDHFNVINTVHGGALYTLMDSAGGATAASYGYRVTTLNSSVEFLHAVKEPITIYGIGRTVKRGKSIIVVNTAVEDIHGKVYAKGVYTFFNLNTPLDNLEEILSQEGQ